MWFTNLVFNWANKISERRSVDDFLDGISRAILYIRENFGQVKTDYARGTQKKTAKHPDGNNYG